MRIYPSESNDRRRRQPTRAAVELVYCAVCCLGIAWSPHALGDPPSWLDPAIVRAATRRAAERAGLLDDPTRDLVTRARLAGLIPHVSARVLRGFGSSATQSAQPVERSTFDDSWGFDLRVALALDRLLFDPVELTAARMRLERFERRVALEREVIDLLASLQRAALAVASTPPSTPERLRAQLDVERLRATFEAVVGVAPDALVVPRRR